MARFRVYFFAISLVLGATVGILIAAKMVEPLYYSIVGKQKYDGYNEKTRQSVYRDDMEDYSSTAEVLIGDKVDGLRKRQKLEDYQKTLRETNIAGINSCFSGVDSSIFSAALLRGVEKKSPE